MNFFLFDSHMPIKNFNFAGSTGLSCFSGSFFFGFFGGDRGGELGDGGEAGVVDGCLGDKDEGECSRAGSRGGGGGGEPGAGCGDAGLDP